MLVDKGRLPFFPEIPVEFLITQKSQVISLLRNPCDFLLYGLHYLILTILSSAIHPTDLTFQDFLPLSTILLYIRVRYMKHNRFLHI